MVGRDERCERTVELPDNVYNTPAVLYHPIIYLLYNMLFGSSILNWAIQIDLNRLLHINVVVVFVVVQFIYAHFESFKA